MIWVLFVTFILVALVIVILANVTKVPLYSFAGFTIIFYLSLVMQAGGLQYQNGYIETVSENVTTVAYTYAAFNDHQDSGVVYVVTIGRLLMFLSFLGFIASFFDLKRSTPI